MERKSLPPGIDAGIPASLMFGVMSSKSYNVRLKCVGFVNALSEHTNTFVSCYFIVTLYTLVR